MNLFRKSIGLFLLLFIFTAFSGVSINESGIAFEPNIVQAAESSGKALAQPTWEVEQGENSVVTFLNLIGVTLSGVTYLISAVVGLALFVWCLYGFKQLADPNPRFGLKVIIIGIIIGSALMNVASSLDLFIGDGYNCTRESFASGVCGNKETSGVVGDLAKRISSAAGSSSWTEELDDLNSVIGAVSNTIRILGLIYFVLGLWNIHKVSTSNGNVAGEVNTYGKAFVQMGCALIIWYHPFVIQHTLGILTNYKIIG